MEVIYMNKLQTLIRERINKPRTTYQKVMSAIIGVFDSKMTVNHYVSANVDKLFQNFDKQFRQYMARYPRNPRNVRFTQE